MARNEANISEIKTRVRMARFSAMRKVNAELIMLYWDIGKVIFEAQAKKGWGKGVVEQLEDDLKEGNPANLGLSARNLWHALKFFQTYQGNEILKQLVSETDWGNELKSRKQLFCEQRLSAKESLNHEDALRLSPPQTQKNWPFFYKIIISLYKKHEMRSTCCRPSRRRFHRSSAQTLLFNYLILNHLFPGCRRPVVAVPPFPSGA